MAYGADFFKPVDPQCPPAQLVDFLRWRFVNVTPAGELLPLPVPAGNGLGFDVRIIPDRRRSDAAILRQNLSLPVVVRYKDVDTFLPGSVSAADFDRDGNLFVLSFNSGFRIYRVSKEALAQGGDATLEPIVQLPFEFGGPDPYGFVVSCDGFAYAGVSLQLNSYPWVQPRIFKVDLAARAVVGDRLLGVGEELHSLALSCQTNELWSARFLNVQEHLGGDRSHRGHTERLRDCRGRLRDAGGRLSDRRRGRSGRHRLFPDGHERDTGETGRDQCLPGAQRRSASM